jgi:guanylate kinase
MAMHEMQQWMEVGEFMEYAQFCGSWYGMKSNNFDMQGTVAVKQFNICSKYVCNKS